MSRRDFSPKVQYPVGDGKQHINLMVDPKAPKPLGSVFLMKSLRQLSKKGLCSFM